jgi:transcriptional regulator with XRE-family HTH domain
MEPTPERTAFCRELKAARQRRGLTLEGIAESTKVCVSYYAALEQNDVKRWPKGLFRRAFFRGYVKAIGLPVDTTTDEFVRLFPDDDRPAASAIAGDDEVPCRLTLDQSFHGLKPPLASRIVNASIDAGVVIVIALGAWLIGMHLGTAAAIASVSYFTLSTMVLGETPAAWARRWQRPPDGGGGGETEQATDEDSRHWISDARRVRPREATARLRVRFKTSS